MAQESTFSQELADSICDLIAEGKSQRSAAKSLNLVESTVRLWRKDFPHFDAQYVRAREDRANLWAEEYVELADNIPKGAPREEIQRVHEQLDARKWVISRILSKVYGDKLGLEHSGTITTALAERISKARSRK